MPHQATNGAQSSSNFAAPSRSAVQSPASAPAGSTVTPSDLAYMESQGHFQYNPSQQQHRTSSSSGGNDRVLSPPPPGFAVPAVPAVPASATSAPSSTPSITKPGSYNMSIQPAWATQPPAHSNNDRSNDSASITSSERNRQAAAAKKKKKSKNIARFCVVIKHVRQHPEELELAIGDMLCIREIFKDGWCWGYNIETKQEGSFPMSKVQLYDSIQRD
eukprot:jgi/Hompol1/3732/HPOL_006708-RA